MSMVKQYIIIQTFSIYSANGKNPLKWICSVLAVKPTGTFCFDADRVEYIDISRSIISFRFDKDALIPDLALNSVLNISLFAMYLLSQSIVEEIVFT